MPDSFRRSVLVISLLLPFIVIGYVFYVPNAPSEDHVVPAGPRSVPTLKLVAVVTRHGNRGPLERLLNDEANWPYGLEELTTVGRLQMYELGVRLSRMYRGFLKNEYSADDLYATSTLTDRSLQSALCVLAGLYPPRGFQVWNENIPWQPIPVFTDSPDKTKQMVFEECPRFNQDSLHSLQNFSIHYSANISAIGVMVAPYVQDGQNMTLTGFRHLCDAVICEEVEGFILPDWTKEVFTQSTMHLYSQAVIAKFTQTDMMVRLLVGPLLDSLLEIFIQKANGTLVPDRRLYYFSGHDVTLMGLQAAVLGIPLEDIGVVYPASAVVFELHQNQTSGAHSIQVLYIDGRTEAEPTLLDVRGCDNSCDLNQLVDLTKRFCGVDFESECQLH